MSKVNVWVKIKNGPKVTPFTETFKDWQGAPKYKCSCGQILRRVICPGVKTNPGVQHEVSESTPALEFQMTFKPLTMMEISTAGDIGQELVAEYVDGYGEKGTEGYKPPKMLPPVAGEPLVPSVQGCHIAGWFFTAQVASEEDRYSVEEVLAMCKSNDLYKQFNAMSDRLRMDLDFGEEENDFFSPAASAGQSPDSP